MTQSTKDHPAILEERAAYDATIARLQAELAEARDALEDRQNLNRRIKAQRWEIKLLLAWSNQVQKTFYEVIDKKRKLEAERDALTAELKAARERLETDHYYVIQNGELVRCEADGSLPEGMDGIACRDETIALLEDHMKAVSARAEAAEAERDALIGAAYAAAAKTAQGQGGGTPQHKFDQGYVAAANRLALDIARLTPTDATAALDRIKAEAELAGWKRGRDDAAGAAKHAGLAFGYERAVQAIRALTPPADLLERIAKEGGK